LVFVDYECPFCKRFAEEVLPTLVLNYVRANRVQFAIRNMPLDTVHPLAAKAAYVAECAAQDDRFWDAHDLLFRSRARVVLRPSREIGETLGIRAPAFTRCIDAEAPKRAVDRDVVMASELGVKSVPTLFFGVVNDGRLTVSRVLSGSPRLREVAEIINHLLSNRRSSS